MRRFPSRCAAAAAVLLALLGLSGGCRREPPQDEAAIRKSLAARPAAEVLAEAEKAAFEPPADGRLTEAQVEMYVAVKRREARIREVVLAGRPDGGGQAGLDAADAADAGAAALGTADLRAAEELGYNLKEYRWVKARVLEAELAAAEDALAQRLEAGRRRYLDSLAARLQAARDPGERAELERRIAGFRRRVEAARPRPGPAIRHNAALLARFRGQLAEARAGSGHTAGAAAGGSAASGGQGKD